MPRRREMDAYAQRISRVLDHVRAQPAGDLSLAALANVACLSAFHFHRVFKAATGENLHALVRRTRLEAAVARLRASPQAKLSAVALDSGFSSLGAFSRAFKQQYALSPGFWDRVTPLESSKIVETQGVPLRHDADQLKAMAEAKEFTVVTHRLPVRRVAYIRVTNPYGNARDIMTAYGKLKEFAQASLAADWRATLIGMSQDDPDVTPLRKCRYDVCLTVPAGVRGEGPVAVREVPAGSVVSVHAAGDVHMVSRAWEYLFHWWLPRSRWQPADHPAMEVYRKTPDEIGWEVFDLDCSVPVSPL